MRQATLRGRNQRLGAAFIGLVLLCALLFVAPRVGEAQTSESDGCPSVCVILVQVDGLEPKDVTEATTPYLWRLAHPQVQGSAIPGSALDSRSGWIWQAPRAVASTGTASATASLLTGAFPERTGVPADDFHGPGQIPTSFAHQRLTAEGFGDSPVSDAGVDVASERVGAPPIETVLGAARNSTEVAAFLGDPGLSELTEATSQASPHWFPPGDDPSATYPEGQYTGDPRLCPIPRYPDGGADVGDQPREQNFNPSRCPANDMTTASKAMADLENPNSGRVGFTFMHLAELGAAKRLAADPDVATLPDVPNPDDPSGTSKPPSVPQALANMDQAIATFVERYAQHAPSKWSKTVLMIAGAHGYQATPLVKRIPDPEDATNPTRDLSDHVSEIAAGGATGSLRLVPQGTMATIYYGLDRNKGRPEERRDAIERVKERLEGEIETACEERVADGDESRCLKGIYYVDSTGRPPSETVAGNFKTWHLDAHDPDSGARTGASGDLVLVAERGWAFGRAPSLPQALASGQPMTNPNTASSGGPQERAVAALINGPAAAGPAGVRNLDSLAGSEFGTTELKYYPVRTVETDTSNPNDPPPVDNQACPDTTTDAGGLTCANDPESAMDDAEATGHEAQPVTVDFATTISALLELPLDQVQGRVLQEAFLNKLNTPCFTNCEEPEVIVPEEPPVELPPPPPPVIERPPGFNFFGLVQKLKARVVDSRDRAWSRASRGSVLSTIRLEGDFGKPEAAVTLTFYRPAASGSRARRRRARTLHLKPIARFDPFVVKRGHVKMRLKVPELFKPTHVGLTVREIARTGGRRRKSGGQPCTTLKTHKPVPFRCTGPARGVIVRIADANRLHERKVSRRSSSRRRR